MATNLVATAQPVSIPYKQSSTFTSKLIPFECTWTIKNINPLINKDIDYPVLYSPIFIAPPDKITTEDKKPVEFRLRFYPKGYGNEYKDFVAFYLVLKNHHDLDTMFTFSVVMTNGEKRHSWSSIRKFTNKESLEGWGYNSYMRRDVLYNPTNGYVSNDSLTIHCVVKIIVAEPNNPDLVAQLQSKYCPPEQLTKSYGDLLESGAHSDVTFVLVDDGAQEIRAHKLILVAQSRVFADMFKAKMKEKTSRVVIAETRVEVFKQVLKFIYTGKVERTSLDGTAMDLLICADKYKLDSLKSICEEHLASTITPESNLSDLFELANRHNALKLKAKVVESVHKKFDAKIQAGKLVQVDRFLSNLATDKD